MIETSTALQFENRMDATKKLIKVLPMDSINNQRWKIIALSGGGLIMSRYIAYGASLDIDYLFTEPIYAPANKECEVAMVSETEEIVIHQKLVDAFDIKLDFIYGEASRKHEDFILGKIYKYRKGEQLSNLRNEKVLLVDDGCETGLRLTAAIKTVIALNAKKICVAVPIIPKDVSKNLGTIVDEVYAVAEINDYVNTELYYKKFDVISEEDIGKVLDAR